MSVRTVKITNVSLSASEQDIREFFSFSGEIEYIEMQSGDERSQVAFVTFKKTDGAETALLLSGATIVDLTVTITRATGYQLPATVSIPPMSEDGSGSGSESGIQKAENVISTMLAKGLILSKDALDRAKSFDEKHQISSSAMTKVSSFNQKVGLREKITTGTSAVNEKILQVDHKYQVSDKARSAIAAAEQKLSNAGTAAMENKYVFAGVSWMIGTISKVAKTASEVGSKAVEKAAAEQQRKPSENDQGNVNSANTPAVASTSDHPSKPEPVQGLIL
ncbi:binding partner of ACD11 1 [Canna indica]|uniref:Binding partner of ACD11 1 n=1 Tax=Canna indica TaxID=4628 RepID=A0AAQ3KDU7_9LILI|nr:binding partner of ACD11 1 [Canna indica]